MVGVFLNFSLFPLPGKAAGRELPSDKCCQESQKICALFNMLMWHLCESEGIRKCDSLQLVIQLVTEAVLHASGYSLYTTDFIASGMSFSTAYHMKPETSSPMGEYLLTITICS